MGEAIYVQGEYSEVVHKLFCGLKNVLFYMKSAEVIIYGKENNFISGIWRHYNIYQITIVYWNRK